MQVKSIGECSKRSILQYFRPSLSYHFSLKTFFLSVFKWPLKTGFTAIRIVSGLKVLQKVCEILLVPVKVNSFIIEYRRVYYSAEKVLEK